MTKFCFMDSALPFGSKDLSSKTFCPYMCLVFWIQEKLDGNREPLWLFPSLYSVQMNSSQLEEKIIVVVLWDHSCIQKQLVRRTCCTCMIIHFCNCTFKSLKPLTVVHIRQSLVEAEIIFPSFQLSNWQESYSAYDNIFFAAPLLLRAFIVINSFRKPLVFS